MEDIHALFQQLCGIDTRDITDPHRLLKLTPSERSAHAINQAAALLITRVQSATGRIPAPHAQWMIQQVANARNTLLAQSGPAGPMPPPVPQAPSPVSVPFPVTQQPAGWQPAGSPLHNPPLLPAEHPARAADPAIVVRPGGSRRGKESRAELVLGVLALVVTMAGAGVLGFFFRDQLFGGSRGRKPARSVLSATPVAVPQGGGAADSRRGRTPSPTTTTSDDAPGVRAGDETASRQHLKNAFKNLRKGFFDEADLDAQKALAASPGMEEAEAMRLTAAYVRQYTALAEDARRALNQSSEVDLGPKWGRGAFIEQDEESITFRVKGKNKRFTIRELDATPGARFRMTAAFLDNAENSVNDLILGAYQFLWRLDSEGVVRRVADDAPSRWLKASRSRDRATVEQARMMLLLSQAEFDG